MAKDTINADVSLSDKLDFLLAFLYENMQQKGIGAPFSFLNFIETYAEVAFGAKTLAELEFYTKCLLDRDFLRQEYNSTIHSNKLGRPTFNFIRFTEKGVLHYLSFAETGINSKKCFVAMSFSSKDKWIYEEAIFPALNELGYEALKVDEDKTLKYRKDESTINDFILLSIKEVKFCIADFTSNKNGVYFEAGYALAKGKQVIYSCHEDDFKNVHFDTNRFPIIRYQSADELKQNLINRIKETIQ